jgi:hypothetical protein
MQGNFSSYSKRIYFDDVLLALERDEETKFGFP